MTIPDKFGIVIFFEIICFYRQPAKIVILATCGAFFL